jgi:hypothetical protein
MNIQNNENIEMKLFVEKYQPLYFKDFDINHDVIQILKDFINTGITCSFFKVDFPLFNFSAKTIFSRNK